ncbi:hypothetical protein ACXR2U_12255 [Jatrophihabitans sp. YIM 134969]
MTEQFTPGDATRTPGTATDDLALHACAELQTLLHAARVLEAEAEEQQWTRVDPVEVPGLRRGAQLLRTSAAVHIEQGHGDLGTCTSA